jgi:hypothetical protein
MTVTERGSGDAVKDAAIFALTREQAEALKQSLEGVRGQADVDYEAMVSGHGIFLGMTNGAGKLSYTFDEEGGYLLIAVKATYRPGFSRILIIDPETTSRSTNPTISKTERITI